MIGTNVETEEETSNSTLGFWEGFPKEMRLDCSLEE